VALTPSTTLYPGTTLYPDGSTGHTPLAQTYNLALSVTSSAVHTHTLAQTYTDTLSITSTGVRGPSSLAQTYGISLGITASGVEGAQSLSQTYSLGLSVGSSGVHGTPTLSQTYGLGLSYTAVKAGPSLSQTYTANLSYVTYGTRPPHLEQTYGLTTAYAVEGFRTPEPMPLDEQPIQKLADFTVSTAAVPVSPIHGAGQAASISATFIAGPDPETVLGTGVEFSNGAIGSWEGEASRVKTSAGSAKVSLSVDTPLTKLVNDLRLFPHIPAAASTLTAGEAVDYWSQQCGLFYDRIEGDVRFYQSGYGHPYAFGADLESTKLYETSYTPIYRSGRTALAFGALSTCAMHEAPKATIPVTVGSGQTGGKLIASTAFTAGAAGTVRFVFKDGTSLALTLASGTVFAYCGSTVLAAVPLTGEGRAWLSVQHLTGSSWAVRLSTSTGSDSGTVIQILPFADSALLLRAEFSGTAGGRYGTYLAIDDEHPTTVPEVQKNLSPTNKPLAFVPGFQGTVWDKLSEFCSVNRLDVGFSAGSLTLAPRSNALTFPANFDRLDRTWERKLLYRQVAVVDQHSKPNRTNDAVLYKADTVYQVSAREVYETTVQTKHSILSVQNPVCVNGIEPFPYKGGSGATGQYVVTGADGYIVSPQWWADNGGKVEVSLTDTEGEIHLKITAPTIDTVRAPYRISEGAADRPALYVCGSGILNTPEERHISTGVTARKGTKSRRLAKKITKAAREGYERLFDSPFCGTPDQVYAAAMGMASEYSAATATYDFEIPNDWDTPTGLGQAPAGVCFPDEGRNVRVTDVQQTASKVSGTAQSHTTIGMSKAARPAGAKLADRNRNNTLRETAIAPLKRSTP
jgi:hypothetical protein